MALSQQVRAACSRLVPVRTGVGLGLPATAARGGAWRRGIRIVVDGRVLADTVAALRVLETAGPPVYYLPPGDVAMDLLRPNSARTYCEWKGYAGYFDFDDGERRIDRIAWAYPDPKPGFEAIRDHLAFYAGKVDQAWVGDEQATPQPGTLLRRLGDQPRRGPVQGGAGLRGTGRG